MEHTNGVDRDTLERYEQLSRKSEKFNPEQFLEHWPEDGKEQRLVTALLVLKSSTGVAKNSTSLSRLWIFASLTFALSIVGAVDAAGVDPMATIILGIAGGATGMIFRAVSI